MSQLQAADEESVKVDRWNGGAVKHALDDAAKNVILCDMFCLM